MKFKILLTTILLLVFSSVSYAGTSFKKLTEKITFVEASSPIVDKTVKQHLQEMRAMVKSEIPFKALITDLKAFITYNQQRYDEFEKQFPDYILENEKQSQALELARNIERLMKENEPETIKKYHKLAMTLQEKHYSGKSIHPELEELKKMKKILSDARESSQKLISDQEIQDLLAAIEYQRWEEAQRIIEKTIERASSSSIGSMVQCYSAIID